VIRRAVVSRIYYSAHHLSRSLLRRVGLRPDTWRRNVHQRVINEMQRQFVRTNQMNAQMIPILRDLRRYRVQADYQLRITISLSDVEQVFGRFDIYLNECRRLLEVVG
jgi:uncharacterized protein (UPF0332 family)